MDGKVGRSGFGWGAFFLWKNSGCDDIIYKVFGHLLGEVGIQWIYMSCYKRL